MAPTLTHARRLRSIAGGSIGNLVEWYDWYAYTFLALYFAPHFFPDDDPIAQQLSTAAVFAVGFLARPLGGVWLGWWADRYGRKSGLFASILMMCAGSLMIALNPGTDAIGIAAPILLVAARLLQGLSVGGEFGASAAYLAEIATARHRGFWASFQYVTLIGGQLGALAVLLILQAVLSETEIMAWGWRIPFFIGAGLAVVGLVIRRGMAETPVFEAVPQAARRSPLTALARQPGAVAIVVGLTAGSTLVFYAFTTYMQKYLVGTSGLATDEATRVLALALLIFAMAQPLFGALSDRVGRWPLFVTFGVLGTLFTVPLFRAIGDASTASTVLPPILAALFIASFTTAIAALIKAELFPAAIRASGVAIGHSIGVALFGGTAEYVALRFKQLGHEEWFFWYVSAMCSLTLVIAVAQRRRIRSGRIEAP